MSTFTGLGHVAVNTADLDRFRRFYEGLLGIPMSVTMRLDHPPFLRHAMFQVDDVVCLHAFELPGYDPEAQGIGKDIGERGRVDHFALMVADEPTLLELQERLRAAGATDGSTQDFGPILSIHITDPDGLQFEISCPNPRYVPGSEASVIEEVGREDWVDRLFEGVARAAALR